MKRIYFLLPNSDSCEKIVDELKQAGIPEKHLHVIGYGIHTLEKLPEASALQTTELAHGLEIGVSLGGIGGLLGGLLAISFPVGGVVLGGGALVATTLAGAGYGALVSAIMKGHEKNHGLDKYESAINAGNLLLLADVPRREEKNIKNLIFQHHPEAQINSVLKI